MGHNLGFFPSFLLPSASTDVVRAGCCLESGDGTDHAGDDGHQRAGDLEALDGAARGAAALRRTLSALRTARDGGRARAGRARGGAAPRVRGGGRARRGGRRRSRRGRGGRLGRGGRDGERGGVDARRGVRRALGRRGSEGSVGDTKQETSEEGRRVSTEPCVENEAREVTMK